MSRSLQSRIEALEARVAPPREPIEIEIHIVDRVGDRLVCKTIIARGRDGAPDVERELPEGQWLDKGPWGAPNTTHMEYGR